MPCCPSAETTTSTITGKPEGAEEGTSIPITATPSSPAVPDCVTGPLGKLAVAWPRVAGAVCTMTFVVEPGAGWAGLTEAEHVGAEGGTEAGGFGLFGAGAVGALAWFADGRVVTVTGKATKPAGGTGLELGLFGQDAAGVPDRVPGELAGVLASDWKLAPFDRGESARIVPTRTMTTPPVAAIAARRNRRRPSSEGTGTGGDWAVGFVSVGSLMFPLSPVRSRNRAPLARGSTCEFRKARQDRLRDSADVFRFPTSAPGRLQ